jgi:putative FmdB family regulatory protein
MPIYEFNCAKCGKPTEVMQKLGERPPPCPHCGSKRMTRAVSKTSFALKGGGWYADLYATPKPGEKKAEGGEAAKPAAEKPAVAAKPGEPAKPAAATPPAAPKGDATPGPASSPPGRRSPSPRKRR